MKSIRKIIEKNYDFCIDNMVQIKEGNTSNKYVLFSDTGKFILRIRNPCFTKKAIISDHVFMDYLKENNFPVAKIIRNKKGEIFISENGCLYEIQSYIDHNKNLSDFNMSSVSNELFSFLGEFHHLSGKYKKGIKKSAYLGKTLIPLDNEEKYFNGPLKYGVERNKLLLKKMDIKYRSVFEKDLNYFITYLEKLQKEYNNKIKNHKLLINHNDFFGNNILFKNNKISGLVDFDFCNSGVYYIDLVEALHGSMIWDNDEMKYLGITKNGDIRLDVARENLQQYFNKNPDFIYDGKFLIKLLIVKIISLAFYPAFDFLGSLEDKIEGFNRRKKVIKNLEEINEIKI